METNLPFFGGGVRNLLYSLQFLPCPDLLILFVLAIALSLQAGLVTRWASPEGAGWRAGGIAGEPLNSGLHLEQISFIFEKKNSPIL